MLVSVNFYSKPNTSFQICKSNHISEQRLPLFKDTFKMVFQLTMPHAELTNLCHVTADKTLRGEEKGHTIVAVHESTYIKYNLPISKLQRP